MPAAMWRFLLSSMEDPDAVQVNLNSDTQFCFQHSLHSVLTNASPEKLCSSVFQLLGVWKTSLPYTFYLQKWCDLSVEVK